MPVVLRNLPGGNVRSCLEHFDPIIICKTKNIQSMKRGKKNCRNSNGCE